MSASDINVALVLKAVDQTKQGIEKTKRNLEELQRKAEQTNRNLRQSFSKSITSIANVASSALNLYNAYDRLAAVQARLMSLEASRQSAQATVIRLQQKLNKLVAEGKQGTEEYVRVQKQLEAAQLRLQQYTLQLEDAQDEINKTYLQMGLSSVPLLTTALDKLSLASLTKAIPAIQGMGMAFKGLMVSMGPIGWTLLAITAAVAAFAVAWNQNWGGIREKTQAVLEWFKGIYEDYIKPALDAIIGGFEWFAGKIKWIWDHSLGWIIDKAKELYDRLVGHSIFPELYDKLLQETDKSLKEFTQLWENTKNQVYLIAGKILDISKHMTKEALYAIGSLSRRALLGVAKEVASFPGVSVVTPRGHIKSYEGHPDIASVIRSYERSIELTKQVFGWGEEHPAIQAYRREIAELKLAKQITQPIIINNTNYINSEVDTNRLSAKIASQVAAQTANL